MEAPIISDEEDVEEPAKQQAPGAFAIPVKKKKSGRESRVDPVAKLRADKTSNALAQLLLSSQGARMRQEEDEEVTSGYYRTLADNQRFEVPWPCDTVYRSDGKRATYDKMKLQEFTQGYLHIIASSLPIND